MTVKNIEVLSELEVIEEELQKVISQKDNEISELEFEINHAKEEAEEAQELVIELKQGNDPKAYSEAVAKQQTANNILEFYTGKLEKLKSEPMVSKEEYEEYTNRIKQILDKVNDDKREQAQELLKELVVIEPELTINIDKGNELLSTLQHEVYKDDASMDNRSGGRVRMEHLENRYKNYELVNGISSLISTPYATSIFNERGNN